MVCESPDLSLARRRFRSELPPQFILPCTPRDGRCKIEQLLTKLRKIPWRLSRHQKYRHRERLRHVDTVVATLNNALARRGESMKKVERWKMEMPTEQEMLPKDKYTVFDRKLKRYRKGIHSKLDLNQVDG